MIRIENLGVTFSRGTPLETRALRGIDLTISSGEFVTVIGSNGAGKSTLLSAVAGDTPVSDGRILIGERDVTKWSTARRAGLVARVFQDPLAGSCGNLSIEENLALAAARGHRRGLGPALSAERREIFHERVSELGLGLENRLNDLMNLLSGGQRQSLALIMATLSPSEVMLLDEHTAALDPGMAEFVLDLTERLVAERKLTTMMVTHSMRQALDVGTRTIMLHEGRIVLDVAGDMRAGLTTDDLVAMFRKVRGQDLEDDSLLIE
ncbi:putative ABC transport system ATP-binding protein [Rhodobium orientis]|uniref:ABC transporter ATP-binding protein n=1 Tax=Rhodobium orientis TaxID=34017 RepID=A0A327JTE8_9HYPH|nr:ABC transporter ATP-binding protein [Rhodobium orientis]MBB4301735.1 putative ABC transport system ATP-binding protein [Rhodobium orientis]MBK5950538.1 ABC transporter ATP-binding protein [Rhodobium orientis]RAI28182.1 ABC transporter ATP-binding protein [Rhodobium orientis]